MPQLRRPAYVFIVALIAAAAFAGGSGVAFAANPLDGPTTADPDVVCSPGQMPTAVSFHDELHPPSTVRVLRSKGPNAGHVETPNFREYVATVLRAEYSTGQDKPATWLWVGAITVKQYAWYKALFWQGGRVSHTDPNTGVTTTECFDVKDTTADQIYKPDQGPGYPGNIPTAANYGATDQTWNIGIRKWMADKSKSRLFLTGYRSGKQRPCGADTTGFKIMQKSLRDCGVKNMTLEETLRKYFEPNLQIMDTRSEDVLADQGSWFGDLAVLADGGADTAWRVYEGTDTGFNSAQVGNFAGLAFNSIKSHGVGDVDGDRRADLVMLTNNGSTVQMAKATGNSSVYAGRVSTTLGSAAESMLVADFNGDMLADVGLLRGSGGQATLSVMAAQANGGFDPESSWWSGPLNLGTDTVMAGDVNGDGKADMIVRDNSTGAFLAATTVASCLDLSAWGACPAVGPVGLGALTSWLGTGVASNARAVVSDFNRDGRDDVIVVSKNGSNEMSVSALRAKVDGGFADPVELWHGGSVSSMSYVIAAGMNVNPDGLGDLAVLTKNGSSTNLMWLKSVEQSTLPASMTPMSTLSDVGLNWSPSFRAN